MSVTFSTTPSNIDFCGNGLGFKIATTNFIITPGFAGIKIINVPANGVVGGDWFDFWDFEKESLFRIKIKSAPPYAEDEFPEFSSIDDIAEALSVYYTFSKYYSVYAFGTRLYVTSREIKYLQWSSMSALSANLSVFSQTDGIEPVYRSDYSIFAQLDYFNGNLSKKVSEFSLEPDVSGNAELSIGKLIKAYVPLSKPDLMATSIKIFFIQKYQLLVGEKYPIDDVMQVSRLKRFEGWVLNGKIDFNKFPGFNIIQEIIDNKIFLNTTGDVELWEDAHYFLNFHNTNINDEIVSAKVKVYYTDLSTHETTLYTRAHIAGSMEICYFPASISKLGLNTFNPTKEIYKYEIWVEHADTSVLCAAKMFKVIEKPMFVRQYAFLNRYGVLENFSAISKTTLKLQTKKTISKHELKVDYSNTDKQYTSKLDDSFNEIEVNTGSISQAQAIIFQDVLESDELYEIVDNNYIPCIINEGSFDIVLESEDIVSIEFSYRKAFER